MRKVSFILFGLAWVLLSCTDSLIPSSVEESNEEESKVEESKVEDFRWAESEGVRNVLQRALQMALITWIPLNEIPWNEGVFEAGNQYTGIPYSSTKQVNKYVGLDVSFHTFMTALHNPYSVLYTENISKPPYSGKNCATYYGTVCSTLVDYAFGFVAPFSSDWLVSMQDFEKNSIQSLEYLKPGDIMYMPGHVFLVYNTQKNDLGEVTSVSYIEAAGMICKFVNQTAEEFQDRINNTHLLSYRYKKIDSVPVYEPSEYIAVGKEKRQDVSYNSALCPNRGDRCVYRVDEEVIINVFDNSFSEVLIKDSAGKTYSYKANPITEVGLLPSGLYSAYAIGGSMNSAAISFYVANPQVNVEKQATLIVSFTCGECFAMYCELCDSQGNHYYYKIISDVEKQNGYVEMPTLDHSEYYCKVVFQTPYGTVVNIPVRIAD